MIKDFWADGGRSGRVSARNDCLPAIAAGSCTSTHAHNEYVQLLAEGGVLLAIPAILIAVCGRPGESATALAPIGRRSTGCARRSGSAV